MTSSATNRPPLDERETLSSDWEEGEIDDDSDDGSSTSSYDDSSEDDSDDDDEIKAPLELIGEFLQYVR